MSFKHVNWSASIIRGASQSFKNGAVLVNSNNKLMAVGLAP